MNGYWMLMAAEDLSVFYKPVNLIASGDILFLGDGVVVEKFLSSLRPTPLDCRVEMRQVSFR